MKYVYENMPLSTIELIAARYQAKIAAKPSAGALWCLCRDIETLRAEIDRRLTRAPAALAAQLKSIDSVLLDCLDTARNV